MKHITRQFLSFLWSTLKKGFEGFLEETYLGPDIYDSGFLWK